MRILVTTHYWLPHLGGIETVAREQAIRLRDRGHRVDVLTSQLRGDPALEDDDGLVIHRLRSANPLERFGIPVPIPGPGLLPTARRLVRSSDVVLAHGHVYPATVAALSAARVYGRPVIVLQHNPFVEYRRVIRLGERIADRIVGGPVLRRAARVLAVSQTTAAYAAQVSGRHDVEVLPNGVDSRRFRPALPAARAEIRASLGLPEDAVVLLTVRRLTYRNDVGALLEATARLRQGEHVVTVVVGDGPQRPSLMAHASSLGLGGRVRFEGAVGNDELADWYRAADIFVLPTKTGEGFGLVLAEAMSSGLPVVATDAGAQREVVDDGRTGWLVPPADPDALAARLDALVEGGEIRLAAACAAHEAAARLSWDAITAELERHLQQVAARTNSR